MDIWDGSIPNVSTLCVKDAKQQLLPIVDMDMHMFHPLVVMVMPVRQTGPFQQRHIREGLVYRPIEHDAAVLSQHHSSLTQFGSEGQVVGCNNQCLP